MVRNPISPSSANTFWFPKLGARRYAWVCNHRSRWSGLISANNKVVSALPQLREPTCGVLARRALFAAPIDTVQPHSRIRWKWGCQCYRRLHVFPEGYSPWSAHRKHIMWPDMWFLLFTASLYIVLQLSACLLYYTCTNEWLFFCLTPRRPTSISTRIRNTPVSVFGK
jgi:hypothetical protein